MMGHLTKLSIASSSLLLLILCLSSEATNNNNNPIPGENSNILQQQQQQQQPIHGGGGSNSGRVRRISTRFGLNNNYPNKFQQIPRTRFPLDLDLLTDDDDLLFDMSKRMDDYGHMRFGKRNGGEGDQFDDYGHMRFGRSLDN